MGGSVGPARRRAAAAAAARPSPYDRKPAAAATPASVVRKPSSGAVAGWLYLKRRTSAVEGVERDELHATGSGTFASKEALKELGFSFRPAARAWAVEIDEEDEECTEQRLRERVVEAVVGQDGLQVAVKWEEERPAADAKPRAARSLAMGGGSDAPGKCVLHGLTLKRQVAGPKAMPHNRGRAFFQCPRHDKECNDAGSWRWEDGSLPFSAASQRRFEEHVDVHGLQGYAQVGQHPIFGAIFGNEFGVSE